MKANCQLRFGYIDKIITDTSKGYNYLRYIVRLDDEEIVTGELWQLKRSSKDDKDDWTYAEGEPVAILLTDDMRTGIIIGALNSKSNAADTTDKNIEKKTFSDGSYVKYDKQNHLYEIKLSGSGNKVNIECADAVVKVSNEAKIDGKLHVTGDATFDGKISAQSDITSQTEVKAGIIALTTHVHLAGGLANSAGPVSGTTGTPQ